jgi:hypothetical protein
MSNAVASGSSHRLSDEAVAAINGIHSALSPRIGILSSPDVQAILEANHFTEFSDLLKPFEDSVEHSECDRCPSRKADQLESVVSNTMCYISVQ